MRCTLLLAGLLGATTAFAASPAAWESFRADVRNACEKAVAGAIQKPVVTVDPFGSESYGIAIAKGANKDGGAPATVVCIYDKKVKTVETSAPFEP